MNADRLKQIVASFEEDAQRLDKQADSWLDDPELKEIFGEELARRNARECRKRAADARDFADIVHSLISH